MFAEDGHRLPLRWCPRPSARGEAMRRRRPGSRYDVAEQNATSAARGGPEMVLSTESSNESWTRHLARRKPP